MNASLKEYTQIVQIVQIKHCGLKITKYNASSLLVIILVMHSTYALNHWNIGHREYVVLELRTVKVCSHCAPKSKRIESESFDCALTHFIVSTLALHNREFPHFLRAVRSVSSTGSKINEEKMITVEVLTISAMWMVIRQLQSKHARQRKLRVYL